MFLSTSFLDVNNKIERDMMLNIVSYIQKHKLDHPFPIRYSSHHFPDKLYKEIRYFAPAYMTNSIWSHWGIEYIKLLVMLSSRKREYIKQAQRHLLSYKKNIELYGGYPELYDKEGRLLQNRIYRSVLYNGWVINYEQAKLMCKAYEEKIMLKHKRT